MADPAYPVNSVAHRNDKAELAHLRSKGDLYSAKIEKERIALDATERRLASLKRRMNLDPKTLKKNAANLPSQGKRNMLRVRHVNSLREQLERDYISFNEKINRNNKVRTDIDDLRRTRKTMLKDERVLSNKANKLYDIVDELDSSIHQLIKQKQGLIEDTKKIDQAMKDDDMSFRLRRKKLLAEKKKLDSDSPMVMSKTSSAAESVSSIHSSKSSRMAWSIASKSIALKKRNDTLQKHKDMLLLLYEKTNATDVDSFIEQYQKGEASNNQTYVNIQELNKQCDILEERVKTASKELDQIRGQRLSFFAGEEIINMLQSQIKSQDEAIELWSSKYEALQKDLEAIQPHIVRLYKCFKDQEKPSELHSAPNEGPHRASPRSAASPRAVPKSSRSQSFDFNFSDDCHDNGLPNSIAITKWLSKVQQQIHNMLLSRSVINLRNGEPDLYLDRLDNLKNKLHRDPTVVSLASVPSTHDRCLEHDFVKGTPHPYPHVDEKIQEVIVKWYTPEEEDDEKNIQEAVIHWSEHIGEIYSRIQAPEQEYLEDSIAEVGVFVEKKRGLMRTHSVS